MVKRPVPLLGVNRDGHPPCTKDATILLLPVEGVLTIGHLRSFVHLTQILGKRLVLEVSLCWVSEPLSIDVHAIC